MQGDRHNLSSLHEFKFEFETNPNLSMQFYTQPGKACSMFMQNFSTLACAQTDLDKYLTFFQDFLKEN
jgi:hypothetical protein